MTVPQKESTFQRASNAAQRVLPQPVARFATKRMFIMLAITLGVLLLVFGFIFGKSMIISSYMKNMKQVVTVATVHAKPTVWQTQLRAVGSLHALEGADLSPEVAGIVSHIGFAAGDDIKKGDLLVQLRDDSDRATLAANRASADEAMRTYKRYVELIKTHAISQANYDSALASMQSTKAQAEAQAAIVEKKAIRAPFDGRVGIRQVDVGQYVGAGTTVVTLQKLDPIYVDFQLSQQDLPQIHVGDRVELVSDTFPGKTFTGTVNAFDPKVDTATRTVHVRAIIANPDKKLLPGMFASVMVDVGKPLQPLTLPQTAITYNTYGNVVFVVEKTMVKGKEQLVAQQRFVTTGDVRGDQVIILGGVTPQDQVVSSGSNKLKNGTVVNVNNNVVLPDQAHPRPKEQL